MVAADVKGKKLKVGEKDVADHNHVDENLVMNIEKLQDIQEELEKINEEVSDKVLEIEQTYSEIRNPVYQRRNDVIKSIPDFWLTAFLSHPALYSLLTEEEHKIFKYFTSLEVENFKDMKMGYTLSFIFQPNPFFEETKLTKTFTYLEDDTTEVTNTPITWKVGMGIPNGNSEKKGNKRPLEDEGFFAWFDSTEKDDLSDDVADIIKEDLWPNPLSYFNNEAEGVEFPEEDDDEAEGESDSEDAEEEEE